MIQENSAKKTANNSLNYMLFAFGAILLIVGIYLSTYTTVEMVDVPMNIPYLGTYNITHAEQVQPYVSIGIIAILAALGLIGLALYNMRRKIAKQYQ